MPKGVMLSHDNLLFDFRAVVKVLDDMRMGQEVLVTYLPLSHIAAQILDLFGMLSLAATVYFADADALKGTLVNTLKVARPTRFVGVPRVYEKFQERMMSVLMESGKFKRMLASWARNTVLSHYMRNHKG